MTTQLAFEFPSPAARRTDPATSAAAARDASRTASRGRLLALRALRDHPAGLTDFELAAVTGKQQTSIGKRRGDCVPLNYVTAATSDGEIVKRPAPSGSLAIVWQITPAGLEYLVEHDG